eukprot:1161587-Pelagomonas_calceolata.AAC.7
MSGALALALALAHTHTHTHTIHTHAHTHTHNTARLPASAPVPGRAARGCRAAGPHTPTLQKRAGCCCRCCCQHCRSHPAVP